MAPKNGYTSAMKRAGSALEEIRAGLDQDLQTMPVDLRQMLISNMMRIEGNVHTILAALAEHGES